MHLRRQLKMLNHIRTCHSLPALKDAIGSGAFEPDQKIQTSKRPVQIGFEAVEIKFAPLIVTRRKKMISSRRS